MISWQRIKEAHKRFMKQFKKVWKTKEAKNYVKQFDNVWNINEVKKCM